MYPFGGQGAAAGKGVVAILKNTRKRYAFLILLPLFLLLFSLPIHASEANDAYDAFRDAIPDEVAELLPDGFFEGTLDNGEETMRESTSVGSVLRATGKVLGLTLGDALRLLASIMGLLVLSSLFRALCPEDRGGISRALTFCSTLALAVLLFTLQRDSFLQLERYFDAIKGVATAFLPLMGTLYAMGGNVRAAVINHSVISAFLTLLESFCAGTVLPIAGICLSLTLLDATTGGSVSLRALAGFIKRTYTLSLSFLMLLLCGVLGVQSTLAKAGDTLALRTARFAAGSFLPVVGGSVSETLRTVAASVEYLRSVAGTGAILVLFFVFLPTFLSVALTRCAFLLGSSAARLLHCDAEEKILAELASVFGYFLAIVASLFVMLIFSLTLFTRCAAAGR